MQRIGEGEKAFFRALVQENGLYAKEAAVKIERIPTTRADYSASAEKGGTQVDVHINITPKKEGVPTEGCTTEEMPEQLGFRGKDASFSVHTTVVHDTGLVAEVVMDCIKDAVETMEVPDTAELFRHGKVVFQDIYRRHGVSKEELALRAVTYGTVGEQFFVSPVRQEQSASDAVVHVVGDIDCVSAVTIERGALSPAALDRILDFHR